MLESIVVLIVSGLNFSQTYIFTLYFVKPTLSSVWNCVLIWTNYEYKQHWIPVVQMNDFDSGTAGPLTAKQCERGVCIFVCVCICIYMFTVLCM